MVTWVARRATPLAPQALVCTVFVQLGPNPEAVPPIVAVEGQRQAHLLGCNLLLLMTNICRDIFRLE